MKKNFFVAASMLLMLLIASFSLSAQSAVKWSASVKMTSDNEGEITIIADIDKGWHVYGFNQPDDGPVATSMTLTTVKGVSFIGQMTCSPGPKTEMDEMFGAKVSYWENTVKFVRKFKVENVANPYVKIDITYMACNDSNCQPPTTETLTVNLK